MLCYVTTLPHRANNDIVEMKVLVSQRSYLWNYTSELHQFLCTLPMAVARSSSGGVVIRYTFPLLQMTLFFAIS